MSAARIWRFHDDGPGPGDRNMEVDRALFESHVPGRDLPVFRLYSWTPPAISLGRFQKAEQVVRIERCRADGVDVVRRITGGGAILHDDELTYSLVCTQEDIGGGSVKESYRRLCAFLLEAYRGLGLPAEFALETGLARSELGAKTQICFAGMELFDLTIAGRKIGGNAQRRRRGVIFQHGSIPLRLYPERARPYFLHPFPSGASAGLNDFLPDLTRSQLHDALCISLCRILQIELVSRAPGGEDVA